MVLFCLVSGSTLSVVVLESVFLVGCLLSVSPCSSASLCAGVIHLLNTPDSPATADRIKLIGDLLASSSRNCWKTSLGFRSILKSFVSKTTLLTPLANSSSPTDGCFSYCTQRISALVLLYTLVRSDPGGFFGKSLTK